jgi:hypothetical protein
MLEEVKQFIEKELTYTELEQTENALTLVFNRGADEYVLTLVQDGAVVKVIETYTSSELLSSISKTHKFKSFAYLKNFLLLFNLSPRGWVC